MKAGLIENWSDIEDIWEYMLYSELGIEEGSNPILVTEVANTPRKNREKMAEVRFHWICVCKCKDYVPVSIDTLIGNVLH